MNALNAQKIIHYLSHPICVEVFDSLPSTNTYLQHHADSHTMRVCIAEAQTQGKGRFNRHWHSPYGENIYLSMLYPVSLFPKPSLTLVVALSVCHSIETVLNAYGPVCAPLQIKWPNDVLWKQQKLSGILIETHAQSVIIGIGINVHMQQIQSHEIDQAWTSMQRMTQQCFDRNLLCGLLIEQLMQDMKKFFLHGFSVFMDDWNQRNAFFGSWIRIDDAETIGECVGVNSEGQMMLRDSDRIIHCFWSGSISKIFDGLRSHQ